MPRSKRSPNVSDSTGNGRPDPLTLLKSAVAQKAKMPSRTNQTEVMDAAFGAHLKRIHARHNELVSPLAGNAMLNQHLCARLGADQELLVSQMAELHMLSEQLRDHDLNYAAREMGQYLDSSGKDLTRQTRHALWMSETDAGPLKAGLGLDRDPRSAWEAAEPRSSSKRVLQHSKREPVIDWRLRGPGEVHASGREPQSKSRLLLQLKEVPSILGEAFVRSMKGPFAKRPDRLVDPTTPTSMRDAVRMAGSAERSESHRLVRESAMTDRVDSFGVNGVRSTRMTLADELRSGQRRAAERENLAKRAVRRTQQSAWESEPEAAQSTSDGLGF